MISRQFMRMAGRITKSIGATMKHRLLALSGKNRASQIYNWLHAEGSINSHCRPWLHFGRDRRTVVFERQARPTFWCYVWPEYRNGIVFRSLVKAFVEEAKNRGAVYVIWDDANGMTDTRMLSKF